MPTHLFLYALRISAYLAVSILSFSSVASSTETEAVNPEILEAIHEAPEAIEELVVSTPKTGIAASPWFLGSLIFALTFFIEEVAIAAGAYFIGSGRLNSGAGFFSLYMGIFLSDLFLYGLGALLHRSRWIRGYIDLSDYEVRTRTALNRGLWVAIIIARIIPGMLIPVFITLGFTHADLRKISFINLIVSGIYSFAVLYLLLYMGLRVSDLMGIEVGFALLVLLLFYIYRQEMWSFLKARYHLLFAPKAQPWPEKTHLGMPPLKAPRALTVFEQLPYGVVYAPVYLSYFWNALRFLSISPPAAANPGIENAGICGESKSQILSLIEKDFPQYIPRFLTVTVTESLAVEEVLSQMQNMGLEFPVVAKPDIGYMSRGVELIADKNSLQNYISRFPLGQAVILQEYLSSDGEAGIYYARLPSAEEPPVIEVALTYFPFVIGDGVSSLHQLVQRDPRYTYFQYAFDVNGRRVPSRGETVRLKISGSTHDGSLHQKMDLNENSRLIQVISEISRSIPEFWVGRYDVKFASVEDLLNGDFKILELNGASGENLSAWDPRRSFIDSYRTLFRQVRTLFEIGRENQRRGFKAVSGSQLLKAYIEQESLLFRLARAKRRLKRKESGK